MRFYPVEEHELKHLRCLRQQDRQCHRLQLDFVSLSLLHQLEKPLLLFQYWVHTCCQQLSWQIQDHLQPAALTGRRNIPLQEVHLVHLQVSNPVQNTYLQESFVFSLLGSYRAGGRCHHPLSLLQLLFVCLLSSLALKHPRSVV